MQKINDYSELASLLTAQLRPGVIANTSVTADEYKKEIDGTGVYIEQTDGVLLIFIKRDGYYKLNFFLQKDAEFPKIHADAPVVTEYASRTGAQLDTPNGRLLFSRQRMRREPSPAPNGIASVRHADMNDFNECKRIMCMHFHKFAGCIPTDAQLSDDIKNGNLYYSEDGGILHKREVRGFTEIRHLAVQESSRKKGVAQSMLHAYISEQNDVPCRVWVVTDNTPAIRFYEKNMFKPDGITTKVYIFEENE